MTNHIDDFDKTVTIFEDILRSLNYSYKSINLNDDDINYIVCIPATGNLKKLDIIPVLMYLNIKDYSLTILAGNIYRFKKGEDVNPFYKLVNSVNELIKSGTFTVNEKSNQILYLDSMYCGSDFKELSGNKIRLLIDSFIDGLSVLLTSIARMENK